MILQPIGDNIVLHLPKEEKKKEQKTSSGIIIPNSGTEQSLRKDIATVVATGEGRTLNTGQILPLHVKEGDEVLFNKFAGTEAIVNDEKYLIIKESDVLAIIRK